MQYIHYIVAMEKIKYNYRLRNINRQGIGLVEAELYANGNRIYFSTHIYLRCNQFKNGRVIHHPLAREYNAYLLKKRIEYEKIELDMLLGGKEPTLQLMKEAIREGVQPSMTIEELEKLVVEKSDRRNTTKSTYRTTMNSVSEFQRGVRVKDITYAWIERYERYLRKKKNADSTINTRMNNLQCLMSEAYKRGLVGKNPFDIYTAPQARAVKERLTEEEVSQLRNLNLTGMEKKVRDAFVFCCCCGLRWSDFVDLKKQDIHNIDGATWIIKKSKKTGITAKIPISAIFGGRGLEIIDKYRSLNALTNIGSNSNANRILKDIFRLAGISKRAHWHLSRHTFVSNAIAAGLPFASVMIMAGHNKPETTKAYYDDNLEDIIKGVLK